MNKPVTIKEKRWWIKQRIANTNHCDIFTERDIVVAKATLKDVILAEKHRLHLNLLLEPNLT